MDSNGYTESVTGAIKLGHIFTRSSGYGNICRLPNIMIASEVRPIMFPALLSMFFLCLLTVVIRLPGTLSQLDLLKPRSTDVSSICSQLFLSMKQPRRCVKGGTLSQIMMTKIWFVQSDCAPV